MIRPAVNLPGAGEDDFDLRVVDAAGLEDGKLRLAIDLEVRHRVPHRIEMAGLAGEVEEVIFPLHERAEAVGVADVGDVDLEPVADALDVVTIPAVIGQKAIHHGNVGAEGVEAPGEVRADKAEAAGDQDARVGELVFHGC
jgi:hypothetical protein